MRKLAQPFVKIVGLFAFAGKAKSTAKYVGAVLKLTILNLHQKEKRLAKREGRDKRIVVL